MSHPPRKKRVRHNIIMEILKIAKHGVKKTHIMYKSGLSYAMLKNYLNHLSTAGFIAEKSGVWMTTEKGLHVIEACELCLRLMEQFQ